MLYLNCFTLWHVSPLCSGLAGPEESSTSEEDNSEEEPDSDASSPEASDTDREGAGALDAATAEWGVGALAANPREKIPMLPDATPRLACVDLDWENIRAVDIFVALRSFVPTGGVLQKVTVYPSDYGLERMAAEAKAGPQGIWQRPGGRKGGKQEEQQQRKRKQELEDDGSSEEESEEDSELDSADEGTSDEELGGSEESGGEEEDSGEDSGDDEAADGEVDPERLRLYERSKLRWYYAIVECDSAETANHLYDQCDGMELMKSESISPNLGHCQSPHS